MFFTKIPVWKYLTNIFMKLVVEDFWKVAENLSARLAVLLLNQNDKNSWILKLCIKTKDT
jgi:hypothetical protein